MRKIALITILILTTSEMFGQNFWTNFKGEKVDKDSKRSYIVPDKLYVVDLHALINALQNAPDKFSELAGVVIYFPNSKGDFERFSVYESSNFDPKLQEEYPKIRSYVGIGIDNKKAYLRFSIAPNGIQTMVLKPDTKTEFIEPYSQDGTVYALYTNSKLDKDSHFICTTIEEDISSGKISGLEKSNNSVYKQFRLALSCTGEYGVYHGGTVSGALAAMNATMTRVNGVFEKDLAVHLNIIANNTSVIYTDASTDPYSSASNMSNWNSELQNNLTSVIGESNYDIGHLFGASGGSGNAGCIGCICDDGEKGSGITSPSDGNPQGDTFDIDYVAHELGHQLGGNHIFSFSSENNAVNVEPGSGSTIMGYAGITGSTDVQSNSDDYFCYASINQIQNNLANKACANNTTISNNPPVINAGSDYTIPKGTAFKLTGTGTDQEGNTLSFCWEQNDDATTVGSSESMPSPTKTIGPNFRSKLPKSVPVRYMPEFSEVLAGNLYPTWEKISDVSRTLNFVLTGRDNSGPVSSQTQTDAMVVTVSSSGPFKITNPVLNSSSTVGSSLNVTWDVAGTTAAPINTANVKISISTDNGSNFTTLIESTPNDGSEAITLPAGISSTNALIMIESIGNIFYAVSPKFLIGYTATTTCNTYTSNTTPISIPDNVTTSFTTKTISVPSATGVISSVKPYVSITHSFISDLYISVQSPQSTQVKLWNRQCSNDDNISVTFSDTGSTVVCASPTSGTYKPYQSLNSINGQSQSGNWILGVLDAELQDIGTFNSWSVEICNIVYTPMGLEDIQSQEIVTSVYPNPNKGTFFVDANIPSGNVIATIYDSTGKLVHNETINHNGGKLTHEISLQAPAGSYLLVLDTSNGKSSTKFIIK